MIAAESAKALLVSPMRVMMVERDFMMNFPVYDSVEAKVGRL